MTINVSDQAVIEALGRLQGAVEKPGPYMLAIGEDLIARAKERFATATGPDGQPWAANSPVTLARHIASRGGMGKRGMNKKGLALAASKKPLQGPSGDLTREFHVSGTDDSVTASNSMIYAAMQQFGGTKAEFPALWGDIPGREFFPITASGDLYPELRPSAMRGED
jgi:phage gpG-like protein